MGPSSCLVLNMVDEDEDTFCIVSKLVRNQHGERIF